MMTSCLDHWEWKKNVYYECCSYFVRFLIHITFLSKTKQNKVQLVQFENTDSSDIVFKKNEIENITSLLKECLLRYRLFKLQTESKLYCISKMSAAKLAQKEEEEMTSPKTKPKVNRNSISNRINAVDAKQALWQRRDSFSSCSSDSAVYYNSQHLQNIGSEELKESPLPHGRRSDRLAKRHRNSSGSSASSNVSCLSEKDKNTSEYTPPSLNNSMNNHNPKDMEETVPLPEAESSPLLGSSAKVQTVIEERISYSCNSEEVKPRRHNLRRNIRKKKCCNCDCSTSHTTFVVRRFTQIRHETVQQKSNIITRSTHNTTVPTSESLQSSFVCTKESSSESKSYMNKKRRREVDKLYDALHEIKWASHFSPDNILSQIDIRRAASCSMFSPDKKIKDRSVPKAKTFRKSDCVISDKVNLQKDNVQNLRKNITKLNNRILPSHSTSQLNSMYDRITRQKNHAANGTLLKDVKLQPAQKLRQSSVSNHLSSNSSRCSKEPVLFLPNNLNSEKDEPLQSNSGINLDPDKNKVEGTVCETSNASISSELIPKTVDFLSNEKNLNISENECGDEIEPPLVTQLNDAAHEDNVQNTISFEESSMKEIYMKSPQKELLNSHRILNFDCSSDLNSETNIMRSTFLDISEEAIQTIDACFREVGGEVAVSTCSKSPELPCLKSVNEVSPVKKRAFDGPPILELCADPTSDYTKHLSTVMGGHFETFTMSCHTSSPIKQICNNETKTSKLKKINNTLPRTHALIRTCGKTKCLNKSINQAAHKLILKKYLNGFRSKLNLKKRLNNNILKTHVKDGFSVVEDYAPSISIAASNHLSSSPEDSEVESLNSSIDERNKCFSSRSISPESVDSNAHSNISEFRVAKKNSENILTEPYHNHRLRRKNVTNHMFFKSNQINTVSYHPNAVAHRSLHVTTMESTDTLKHMTKINNIKEHISVKYSSCLLPKELPKIKEQDKDKSHEDVLRPTMRFGMITFHYKAITVNRNESYTQILLKITRARRVFLTHEALTELKDAVTGASNDVRCQVLIINGSGESFCSGVDLRPLIGPRKVKASTEIAIAIKDLIQALADFHKPLVAVINGDACGLGLTLLNHADVSIASDKATFCMPYVHLGYSPEGGATLTLPQAVGSTIAMDLLLRGRILTAREACKCGLVSEVLEAKRLPYELVSRVKVLVENPRSALETTKALFRMRLLQELPSVLENEVKLLPRMWLSSTCQEALQKAFKTGLISD